MISNEVEYIKPETLEEAREIYNQRVNSGLSVVYYSGGTEINTFTRKQKMQPDVLIDLKSLGLLKSIKEEKNHIIIGSCVNLNQIIERNIHPIFEKCLDVIADHTTRNHITFGGNICGRLPYREAVLPLLLMHNTLGVIQTQDGTVKKTFNEIFKNRLILNKGDFLVAIEFEKDDLPKLFSTIRRTKSGKIDYPLIHLVGVINNNKMSFATSGYKAFPEAFLEIDVPQKNDTEVINKILENMSSNIKSDGLGNSDYRENLMALAFSEILNKWGIIS